ncbi:hypothetical protein [Paenibacillus sp. OK076]|uniref:hypothetical protein n=1 Tax=Paenibacillus sp. OK076 TaxID=1884379 RepID=UPI000B82F5C2|nr:hypothetical protein [Paenibacillus sp. OK076]
MRSPAHRTKGATAPVLREAEQGARAGGEALPTAPKVQQLPSFAKRSRESGQKAKPCPPHQRCNSSRPSRSGAGSRAGGEALHVMVPLELGRDRRCQAADPATSAPTPPVT